MEIGKGLRWACRRIRAVASAILPAAVVFCVACSAKTPSNKSNNSARDHGAVRRKAPVSGPVEGERVSPKLRKLVDWHKKALSVEHVKHDIKFLCGLSTRSAASTGAAKAGEYIEGRLKRLGYTVVRQEFAVRREGRDLPVFNVVGTRRGGTDPSKKIVVLAHYDSHGTPPSNAPGADDNGSGVAALLDIALALRWYTPRHTVEFLFTTAEEIDGSGAIRYLSSQKEGRILAAINLDVIGYSNAKPKNSEDLEIVTKPGGRDLLARVVQAKNLFVPSARIRKWVNAKYTDADYGKFWARSVPTVMLSADVEALNDESNPNVHTARDTAETLYYPLIHLAEQIVLSSVILVDQMGVDQMGLAHRSLGRPDPARLPPRTKPPSLPDSLAYPRRSLPESLDALVNEALASIRDNRPDRYLELTGGLARFKRACHEIFKTRTEAQWRMGMAMLLERIRNRIKDCHALMDWSRAVKVGMAGGVRMRPMKGCTGIFRLTDIEVQYRSGGLKFVVRLDDPFVAGKKAYGLSDPPSCKRLP